MTSNPIRRLTVSLLLFYIATLAIAGQGQSVPHHNVCPAAAANDDATSSSCQDPLLVRGGDSASDDESKISDFLSQKDVRMEKFHVHGWRWHTMSLVRDAGRLKMLAQRSSAKDDCPPIKQAVDYVVGFNMKGLHKIEADLFFPWMRKKLTAVDQTDLAQAFGSVMDQLENDRKKVAKLGESIQRQVSLLCDESKAPVLRTDAVIGIARDAEELETVARTMMETENSLLVPSVAQVVPEGEQKSFNNKVLRNLGILDSRLHLVGMHEAVWESNITEEKEMFKKAIPSIPQRLIPRWKRNLYIPRTNVLDV
eukprot:CAMPEP_0113641866 /NCGR_PEP_ID=MMETSP0017_2-20120614/21989_1 /TAXON_ID=2856 /ORGANISM="Cylindrotheca closterium" /LENGTH=309 /DNA_ID=CAMNT_0000553251 /DNA_START=19 /DNA_END=948 /DNA_ORIENTATION=+ /assembly_acc=CAM_ASM_000147